jgi:salicylate biosynthesis isochorismate synthase
MAENTPRWVRVQVSLADIDPWTLLPALQADGARLMAWSSPQQHTSFVAVGAVTEHRPEGTERFNQASCWWEPIMASLETQDLAGQTIASSVPACLAGFAFRDDPNRSDEWAAWGDGALCVPEILVWTTTEGSIAVFTVDTDQHTIASRLPILRHQLSEWMAHTPDTTVEATPSAVLVESKASDAWEQWRARVEAAKATIALGDLQKVVLARAQAYQPADAHLFDPLATALALRDRQVDSTTFLIRRKDGQAFLGSSPEILVRLADQVVNTVALAGTRRRDPASGSKDAALGAQLLDSEKDRHEQQLVAIAITEALAPAVTDLTVADVPEVVCHPDVQHLRTAIQGRLSDDTSIFDLVDRLHPTPAVGGLPRESALAWLDDNERLDRGWYAGPIGWIGGDGNGEFVVAIRSVLMAEGHASAFAGCGLVASSNPADEWEESQVKLQTVRQGLAAGLDR